MTIEDVFKMFSDLWHIVKKLWQIQDTDEYWDEVVGSLGQFSENWDNQQFAKDLALALSDELERRAKNGKKTLVE